MLLKRSCCLAIALLVLLLFAPAGAHAQPSDWRERRTERFAILYVDGDAATAEQYAGFVDAVYDEISAVFGHQTAVPVTLRLYPTLERYQQINPLARSLTGVVAHADFQLHEVVVILSQTARQTPEEVQNNVRHELTHIVIAELSGNRLNVGFQEGIAQYVERPAPELEQRIRLLQRAYDQQILMPWSDLDDRETVYGAPEVGYPESMSVVAFLVEKYSFAKLREFLTIAARSSGYRSALERTYGVAPDELERQWRDWLPSYLAGGYKRNALISTFAGVFPMDAPRYVVIAMLDEPHGTAETGGYATAGQVAAPSVGRIINRIGPLLGVIPDETRDVDMSDLQDAIAILKTEKP